VCTRGYAHIPLITPRSAYEFLSLCIDAHIFLRVLLATIRDQGLCPCPRCLVPKTKLDRLGLIADMNARVNNARHYRDVAVFIEKAHRAIFEEGAPIGGVTVQRLLKSTSNVPMSVSCAIFSYTSHLVIYGLRASRMHLSSSWVPTSICRKCSSLISCTSLSLEYGRPFSRI
jgi:hypothetical protein